VREFGARSAIVVIASLSSAGTALAEATTGPHAAAYPALNAAAHWIATGFEVAGVSTILLVAIASSVRFARALVAAPDWMAMLPAYRADLGRGVLLGLELLVAADIVGTVAIAPTFSNLGVLAIVIMIRTFLSISLGVEIEGQWLWRRREVERRAEHLPPN
jgi:uncharacterized membrane protein